MARANSHDKVAVGERRSPTIQTEAPTIQTTSAHEAQAHQLSNIIRSYARSRAGTNEWPWCFASSALDAHHRHTSTRCVSPVLPQACASAHARVHDRDGSEVGGARPGLARAARRPRRSWLAQVIRRRRGLPATRRSAETAQIAIAIGTHGPPTALGSTPTSSATSWQLSEVADDPHRRPDLRGPRADRPPLL